MGLDSIELLMDFENYFGVHIENAEAENIFTIQQMVDCICKHRSISENDNILIEVVSEKICILLWDMHFTFDPVKNTDFIFTILLPTDSYLWKKFETALTYIVPKPHVQNNIFLNKASRLLFMHPNYNYKDVTIKRFTEVIYATNYKQLVIPGEIKKTFEVYIAIAGMTAEKTGIDPYEISPEKEFVKDLGLN